MKGENERLLIEILNESYPNQWVAEFQGITGRKFRFDAANPTLKIALEVDGGIWLGRNGGHTSGFGRERDMEKLNLAVLEGWRILTYSPKTLKSTPWKIIADVRKLCGVDASQAELCLDGLKQTTLQQVQVKLS